MNVGSLAPEVVVPLLRGRLGRPYLYVERCASTQRLLAADAPEGAIAVAEEQTAARGRGDVAADRDRARDRARARARCDSRGAGSGVRGLGQRLRNVRLTLPAESVAAMT